MCDPKSGETYTRSTVRVIAIVGCDGSGKSTLAAELVNHLTQQTPTKLFYLGQSSGRICEWILTLPIIGHSLGQYLLKKAGRVHSRPGTPPGNITALVIFLLSCWRAYKFHRMLIGCQRGELLITDRYPQAEIPGFSVDGPQLAKTTQGNWWIRKLRAAELKLYHWMASYPPLLLIRLAVDEQTAYSRKPDHNRVRLREKIALTSHLNFNGAEILDLDGREPAAQVLEKSLFAIRAHCL